MLNNVAYYVYPECLPLSGYGLEWIWCISVAVAWLTVGQLMLAMTDFGSDWPVYFLFLWLCSWLGVVGMAWLDPVWSSHIQAKVVYCF